jgi:predicted acylesterase/phospholipase RssA
MELVKGVFKGGGAKGALYAGALDAVQEHKIWFSEVAGSSAGAITAAFVAAGARPDDLRKLEEEGRELLAFPSTMNSARNLRNTGGILSFEALRDWLAASLNELCTARLHMSAVDADGPTFDQLAAAGAIPLHIACADLLWRAPVVFNARLTPDLYVAHAAAASSSIPFVFEAPRLTDANGAQPRRIVVSDGGVMANLPMFVFTDDAYRSVVGLGLRGPERVVGFTFVDPDAPRYTSQAGEPGKEYRERFKNVSRATIYSEELRDAGLDPSMIKQVRRARSTSTRWWSPQLLALHLINAVLRIVEIVVLTPFNAVLGAGQWRGYRPTAPSIANRRARRWIRFGDRVVGVAPGYVVAGVLLVIPVLIFGIPRVLMVLWPDWSALATGGVFRRIILVLIGILLYLLIVVGCLLVVVFAVLGLASYLIGWVVKPVAASIGNHLVATFMRNPQEPAWAGAGGDDVIIRIVVPKGWNALRSTANAEDMTAELERTRTSVGEQLGRAGLGSRN